MPMNIAKHEPGRPGLHPGSKPLPKSSYTRPRKVCLVLEGDLYERMQAYADRNKQSVSRLIGDTFRDLLAGQNTHPSVAPSRPEIRVNYTEFRQNLAHYLKQALAGLSVLLITKETGSGAERAFRLEKAG